MDLRAAFVANAKLLQANDASDAERHEIIGRLLDPHPALRAVGLFDIFALRDESPRQVLCVGPPSTVDTALDSSPGRPASANFSGPTLAPDELAGRKVVASY